MNTALSVIFFLFLNLGADEAGTDDEESWTNNLHTDCEHKDLMEKLKKDPRKCASAANGTDKVQWEECKKKLKGKIIAMCPNSKMRQVHIWRSVSLSLDWFKVEVEMRVICGWGWGWDEVQLKLIWS